MRRRMYYRALLLICEASSKMNKQEKVGEARRQIYTPAHYAFAILRMANLLSSDAKSGRSGWRNALAILQHAPRASNYMAGDIASAIGNRRAVVQGLLGHVPTPLEGKGDIRIATHEGEKRLRPRNSGFRWEQPGMSPCAVG